MGASATRQTQAARSETMRRRLVEACIQCLVTHGYSGTTFSHITDQAGVSRGAPLHHFESKSGLIAATAEQLVRRVYIRMGEATRGLDTSSDQLPDLIYQCWQSVFRSAEYQALHELLVASRREPELATILRQLWTAGRDTIVHAANHYLEPIRPDDQVRDYLLLTQWLLRGMAEDLHLVEDQALLDKYLRLWSNLLASHLRSRPNVVSPPPRPPLWDKGII